MKLSKTQLIAVFVAINIIFFSFDLHNLLTLENFQAQKNAFLAYRAEHPVLSVLVYGLAYIAVTGLSLPGATVLTLAGGTLFGLTWGTVIVSFASSIGATLAFLAARFLFRDSVERHFAERLTTVNNGIAKDGGYYLFTLRLIPLFPFVVINLVMGLTSMRTTAFYWISQIGMLPGTLLYVNAGTQLATIKSLSDIASPILIGSFALLGIFPLIAKKALEFYSFQKSEENPEPK
jgi:uncharacterized membrane protein YdjX (TVP38/TMEM64 family)